MNRRWRKMSPDNRAQYDKSADALLTRLYKCIDSLNSRFDGVESNFRGMDSRFDGVESNFRGMDSRFDGVESNFRGMDSRFDAIGQRLDELERRIERLEQTCAADNPQE